MQWSEVRTAYPNEWLIIKALKAETDANNQRQLRQMTITEHCVDGSAAMQSYRRLHQQYPTREFYFVHTSRDSLEIREQLWVGVRGLHATADKG
jgi:hypothetical protein